MAIATIVARGYGSFGGGIVKVPTRGYTIGAAIIVAPAVLTVSPLFRTYSVAEPDRGYEVEADDRTFAIPDNDRVYEVN